MIYNAKYYNPGEINAGIYAWGFQMELSDDMILDEDGIMDNFDMIRQMLSQIYDIPKPDIIITATNETRRSR
jgi:hypothetical protein